MTDVSDRQGEKPVIVILSPDLPAAGPVLGAAGWRFLSGRRIQKSKSWILHSVQNDNTHVHENMSLAAIHAESMSESGDGGVRSTDYLS
jgi:hypothetical protein